MSADYFPARRPLSSRELAAHQRNQLQRRQEHQDRIDDVHAHSDAVVAQLQGAARIGAATQTCLNIIAATELGAAQIYPHAAHRSQGFAEAFSMVVMQIAINGVQEQPR